MKTRIAQLGEICEINPATDYHFDPDEQCSFVPMEALDDDDARITRSAARPYREVAKGYTQFAENDVIVAKITPCMENGKCAIVRNLRKSIGFGSTEFHVLRATKHVIPEWLFYFWRFPLTRKLAAINMTGSAGQKRVPVHFLETLEIPLPDLPEQHRMAERLEQADQLRRIRRYALELSDTFLPAAFLELFGDPPRKGWSSQRVEELCELVRGSSPRPQGDPRYFGGPVPRLMIADITRDGIYVTPQIDSLTVEGAVRSRAMSAGSVVMAVSGAVGLPAILRSDACIHDGFVGFRALSSDILPIVFYYALFLRQTANKSQAAGAIWQNLTTDQVNDWSISVPPLPLQQNFAVLAERVEHMRAVQREALRQAEHLFQSVLEQAFELP